VLYFVGHFTPDRMPTNTSATELTTAQRNALSTATGGDFARVCLAPLVDVVDLVASTEPHSAVAYGKVYHWAVGVDCCGVQGELLTATTRNCFSASTLSAGGALNDIAAPLAHDIAGVNFGLGADAAELTSLATRTVAVGGGSTASLASFSFLSYSDGLVARTEAQTKSGVIFMLTVLAGETEGGAALGVRGGGCACGAHCPSCCVCLRSRSPVASPRTTTPHRHHINRSMVPDMVSVDLSLRVLSQHRRLHHKLRLLLLR
jgi:hypothetical protein